MILTSVSTPGNFFVIYGILLHMFLCSELFYNTFSLMFIGKPDFGLGDVDIGGRLSNTP
jgi:hypothetical protein